MRILKKVLSVSEVIIIMILIICGCSDRYTNAVISSFRQRPVVVDVVLYDFEDKFISLLREKFEDIQKQNEGKVIFEFYDGKRNQAIENEIFDNIKNKNIDILLVNLVDTRVAKDVVDMFKQKNIPIIFFNREPTPIESIKSYNKAYYVGKYPKEVARLQGEIIVDLWNKNREFIDKNGDGVLQYVMLQGGRTSVEAQERTKSVISTIEKSGIRTELLESSISDWKRDWAKINMESIFLKYGNKIEAVIANNDEMAIGAVEALQKYGYNLGDKDKTIAIVGIDATPEAEELIKKGYMAGTVSLDISEMTKVIYTIGLNVLQGKEPLYGLPYKFDETGVTIRPISSS